MNSCRGDGIVRPDSAPRRGDQTGIAQHFEMMRDRRLTQIEPGHHIAGAERFGLRGNEPENLEAAGIAQRLSPATSASRTESLIGPGITGVVQHSAGRVELVMPA